jgi:hemerythrin
MAIVWTDDLATGSVKIDQQHQAIFQRINTMLQACREGKGKTEVGGLLAFLGDYVVSHFDAEERYMKQYAYEGYAAHKAQHVEFMKNLAGLKKKVEEGGIGVHTVIATNHLVVSWFVNHIRKVDTQLGSFLKDRP